MTGPPETCAECGFDSAEWNHRDTVRTLANTAVLVDLWTDGLHEEARNTRPASDTWTVNEYVDHLRETFFGMRLLSEVALTTPGADLGPAIVPGPPGPTRRLDSSATVARFAAEAAAFEETLRGLPAEELRRTVTIGGTDHSVVWAARHAVHDFWHHLVDIAAIRRALGDATPTQSGDVARLNISDGGVPKRAIDTAVVGRRGLEGDRQAARQHHGRPWQALCLWSADVIDELAAAGHPIGPGDAGENITVRGLDWRVLRAGTILEMGEVRCQLSAPAVPCSKNNRWFSDGDSRRIHHDNNPAWTRWYASVLDGGAVTTGDPVTVVG